MPLNSKPIYIDLEALKNYGVIYEREIPYYENGFKNVLFLKAGKPLRRYNNPKINEKDRLIFVGIRQRHKCPYCGELHDVENKVPYSFQDQQAMWEAIFNVKVLIKEKERQIKGLESMINRILKQSQLDDIFKLDRR